MKITLKITFDSDWHIGEGAGASGHIDRIVRRHPEDDLPYVPAKTLTGILRDGCEKVARGLDDGKAGGAWQSWASMLFGRQSQGMDDEDAAHTTPALVAIGPARFAPGLRHALRDRPELKSALVFIKPGIRLDEHGVAVSEMLRFEEVVLAGAELEAQMELDPRVSEGEAVQAALALIAAGTKAVERLGGKRRRGNGRCRIELVGLTIDFAQAFDGAPPVLEPQAGAAPVLAAEVKVGDPNGWHVIPLDLELLSPVAIPAGTAGNVIATRDHIPGSLLLPALDKRLRALLGSRADELTNHLAAGRIQVRNAYPCQAGQRLLPVPSALMAEKEHPGKTINELAGHADDDKQRKQLRAGYAQPGHLNDHGEDKSPLVTVKTLATTHAVIDDAEQRPNKKVGGVYTYEAIAPGQTFRTEIWIARNLLEEAPDAAVLNGLLRIGRAKKDDYGKVMAKAGTAEEAQENAKNGAGFTLWLVAPMLLRDERLRPITDAEAFCCWLSGELGAVLKLEKSFARGTRDDGWNNAWREPRPTRFGLAAGSCFRFSSSQPLDAQRLARIEWTGLGERRGEGYGEVRIDSSLLAGSTVPRQAGQKTAQPADPSTAAIPTLAVTDFARQLVARAWRTEIRRQALTIASAFTETCLAWTLDTPTSSQLGALRSLFEPWGGPARLKTWLAHLKVVPNRKDKWPKRSRAVLEQFAASDHEVWSHLSADDLPLIDGLTRGEMKNALAAEATSTLWLTAIGVALDRRANQKAHQGKPQEDH